MNSPKHIISFDHLRILACFGVVLLHVSAYFWYNNPVSSPDWLISNAYNIITRISVPLFVMISGALFLDPAKEISIKALWSKHIFRFFVIYVIWMTAYGISYFSSLSVESQTWKNLFLSVLNGRYHLWFLPMLLGIYALIPLLRTWIRGASKNDIAYFLFLFMILQIILTSFRSLLKTPDLLTFLENFQWELICSYVGYFILGYYLFHVKIPSAWNRVLFITAPFFYLANLCISTLYSRSTQQPQGEFFDSFGIFTFLFTICVFQFFTTKTRQKESSKLFSALIGEISKCTLGIYLIHLWVIDLGFLFPLYHLPAILAIPLISFCVFLISLLISMLLRRLPFLGKYVC